MSVSEQPLVVPVDPVPAPVEPPQPAAAAALPEQQVAPQQPAVYDPVSEVAQPPALPPRSSIPSEEQSTQQVPFQEQQWDENEEYYPEEEMHDQSYLYGRRPAKEQWHWAYNRIVQVGNGKNTATHTSFLLFPIQSSLHSEK